MATYTVGAGESWFSIAGSQMGNQRYAQELADANGNVNLVPGMQIYVPEPSGTPIITNERAGQWGMAPSTAFNAEGQLIPGWNAQIGSVTGGGIPPASTRAQIVQLTGGGGTQQPPSRGRWWRTRGQILATCINPERTLQRTPPGRHSTKRFY